MITLRQALDARFTDFSELEDITNYGCQAGVNGFIYSTELAEFFDEHEDEIEDVLEELGLTPNDIVSDTEYWSFQELKEKSVWIVIEDYAFQKVENAVESASSALPAGVS